MLDEELYAELVVTLIDPAVEDGVGTEYVVVDPLDVSVVPGRLPVSVLKDEWEEVV